MSLPVRSAKGAILVVDDEEPIGHLLQEWLADEGYEAVYADGFASVEAALAVRSFDLVTLDIMMPGVGGLEVLAWIKGHHPDVGVVMATGLADMDTVLQAIRLGASGYLIKPFALELISEEIGLAMERQRLIAENRAYQRELEQRVVEQTRDLRTAYEELSRKVRELEGRDRLVHFQMSGPGLAEAAAEVLRVLHDTLGIGSAVAYGLDPAGARLRPLAALAAAEPGSLADDAEVGSLPGIDLQQTGAPGGAGLCADAVAAREPRYGPGGAASVPLVYQGEVLGVIALTGLQDTDQDALVRLGREASVVVWSARVADELDSGRLQVDELLEME